MEVSSSSMKVARVTVRAMTQGLIAGRDLGVGVESSFGGAGGATAGAVATGGSKTASLAKVDRPFPLPQQADVSGGVADLYMTTVLYPASDVLRRRGGSDIFFFEELPFRIF